MINQRRQVRFNLLERTNTTYSEGSVYQPVPLITADEMDEREAQSVADFLLGTGDRPPPVGATSRLVTAPRLHATQFCLKDTSKPKLSLLSFASTLLLQLLYGFLQLINRLPPDVPVPPLDPIPPPPPRPSRIKPLKFPQRQGGLLHADGQPMSHVRQRAYLSEEEQEYIVPPTKPDERELRIRVTRDFSERKLDKHEENQMLIYRVPYENMLWFGITARAHGLIGLGVRKPEDSYDGIRVMRHGHPSWDIGNEECWLLLSSNTQQISYTWKRIEKVQPTLWTNLKRILLRNTVHRLYRLYTPGVM